MRKLNNQAMQRKIEAGECIDLKANKLLGHYYLLTPDQAEKAAQGGIDFADSGHEAWIWSIGRATRTMTFERDGASHIIPKGTVLASRGNELYQKAGFECLFLR